MKIIKKKPFTGARILTPVELNCLHFSSDHSKVDGNRASSSQTDVSSSSVLKSS